MFFNYNRKKNIQNTAHSTKELEHFQNIQSLFFVPHFSSPYSPWPGNHYPEFCFSRSLLFLYVVFFSPTSVCTSKWNILCCLEFPGILVGRTWCFHSRSPGSSSGLGELTSHIEPLHATANSNNNHNTFKEISFASAYFQLSMTKFLSDAFLQDFPLLAQIYMLINFTWFSFNLHNNLIMRFGWWWNRGLKGQRVWSEPHSNSSRSGVRT